MFPFGSSEGTLSCSGGVILFNAGKFFVGIRSIRFKELQNEKV